MVETTEVWRDDLTVDPKDLWGGNSVAWKAVERAVEKVVRRVAKLVYCTVVMMVVD